MSENKTYDDTLKAEIIPEYTKEEFLRATWIALANEDAPIEIFDEDIKEIKCSEHQILIDNISVDVSYQASVGYDREEPYIAYETYYEDEPYLTTESYYDYNTKSQRTRQVTKYKKVQRQRQVTKYKTVTDWSPLNGNHHVNSIVTVENVPGQELDKDRFLKSFTTMQQDSSVLLDKSKIDEVKLNESAHEEAMSEHRSRIYSSVCASLPGDHSREVHYHVDSVEEHTSTIYTASEYEASIFFKGKMYTKKAFPFGVMKIGGDVIENTVSLDNVTQKMKNELSVKVKNRKEQIEKNIWETTKLASLICLAFLCLSIITSLLIKSTVAVIIAFVAAVALFVYNHIYVKKVSEEEKKQCQNEIMEETKKTEHQIKNYAVDYKIRQKEALNNKLKSLGLKLAGTDELEEIDSLS